MSKLVLEEFCRTADTPNAKCRCGGGGQVCDREQTEVTGKLVMIKCKRCRGTGLKPVPKSRARMSIAKLMPSLSQSTWSRKWQPFYDLLLSWCYQESMEAEIEYSQITEVSRSE
ncbi:antitermination protein [Limnobaculum eriocheiris]|uniref:antitermination protein Q n=1 Tax=Limnobaculum eriocheiris TaxID=2897391 RepID=UPI003B84AC95